MSSFLFHQSFYLGIKYISTGSKNVLLNQLSLLVSNIKNGASAVRVTHPGGRYTEIIGGRHTSIIPFQRPLGINNMNDHSNNNNDDDGNNDNDDSSHNNDNDSDNNKDDDSNTSHALLASLPYPFTMLTPKGFHIYRELSMHGFSGGTILIDEIVKQQKENPNDYCFDTVMIALISKLDNTARQEEEEYNKQMDAAILLSEGV